MIFKAKNGFTLTELMVGTVLMSITTLVFLYLAQYLYSNYNDIQSKIQTEKSLVVATYNMQKLLSLAVNLNTTAANLNGVNTPLGQGLINDYVMDSMNGAPGAIDTVGIFLREKGGYQTPGASDLAPAAIFYARPSPTTSGVLFLDVSASGVNMTPSYSGVYFDKIVEFYLSNFLKSPSGVLTSVELSITMRRFLNETVSGWTFCPAKDIQNAVAGCTGTNTTFKDVSRKTRITLSNQILSASNPREYSPTAPYERTFGNLYLFPIQ